MEIPDVGEQAFPGHHSPNLAAQQEQQFELTRTKVHRPTIDCDAVADGIDAQRTELAPASRPTTMSISASRAVTSTIGKSRCRSRQVNADTL